MIKNIALAASGLVLAMGTAVNAQTYTSSGNSIIIPDNSANGATLDIVITDEAIIKDLNVGLIITHTWQGDVSATLEHVGIGGPQSLINRPGNPLSTFGYEADNYGNLAGGAYFFLDDEAVAVYDRPPLGGGPNNTTGTANVVGSWRPDGGLLSAFDGQNILGTWRLRVVDHAAGDTGAIRAMQLVFDTNPIPAPGAVALLGIAGLVGRGRRRRA
jgi:subtilisin-like proprotein convertase family protein